MIKEKKSDLIPLTGLWKNQGKDGKVYLSGKLSPTIRILVFANPHKRENSNDPDYSVLLAPVERQEKPKEETTDDF